MLYSQYEARVLVEQDIYDNQCGMTAMSRLQTGQFALHAITRCVFFSFGTNKNIDISKEKQVIIKEKETIKGTTPV